MGPQSPRLILAAGFRFIFYALSEDWAREFFGERKARWEGDLSIAIGGEQSLSFGSSFLEVPYVEGTPLGRRGPDGPLKNEAMIFPQKARSF